MHAELCCKGPDHFKGAQSTVMQPCLTLAGVCGQGSRVCAAHLLPSSASKKDMFSATATQGTAMRANIRMPFATSTNASF